MNITLFHFTSHTSYYHEKALPSFSSPHLTSTNFISPFLISCTLSYHTLSNLSHHLNPLQLVHLSLPHFTLSHVPLVYPASRHITSPHLATPYLYLTLVYLLLDFILPHAHFISCTSPFVPYHTLLHFTSPHLTSPHLTSPHLTSPRLALLHISHLISVYLTFVTSHFAPK